MQVKLAILESEKNKIKIFLKKFSLEFENDINLSLYIEENNEIIGTISASNNIIKGFAVDQAYKGQIANKLISELINKLYQLNFQYTRVYTLVENKDIFKSLNYYEIISSDKITLLESRNRNIVNTLENLKNEYNILSNNTGAIVMNANPFTLGHRYLIETASLKHDLLIVFILEEEKSDFSFNDRFKLVSLGVSDLKNVVVVPSSNYLISSLTFPTYFLKKDDSKIEEQAKLDALIFKKYFVSIFNLKKRYLGTEEDLVTNKYNKVLLNVLGDFIEVIPRKEHGSEIISASRVRKYLKTKEFDKIKEIVPYTTYKYLIDNYG